MWAGGYKAQQARARAGRQGMQAGRKRGRANKNKWQAKAGKGRAGRRSSGHTTITRAGAGKVHAGNGQQAYAGGTGGRHKVVVGAGGKVRTCKWEWKWETAEKNQSM